MLRLTLTLFLIEFTISTAIRWFAGLSRKVDGSEGWPTHESG